MKDYYQVLRIQLQQLEGQRACLPSEEMDSTDSVLMTALAAVLEESKEIRRRIGLVREVVSWGLMADDAVLHESITEAEEWAIPSKKEIW